MTPLIVLGVSGGIAAYKACELLRLLKADERLAADVRVVPTSHALAFVGAATFEALSGHPVVADAFTDVPSVAHVGIGQHADLVVIAPATADLMARASSGRADDLLSATLLATEAPVLMAPAMHTQMWQHPATRANVDTLRARHVTVVNPAIGRLTGRDSGAGRLPDPEHLAQLVELLLARPGSLPYDLAGRRIVVTAGGTREPLDPVRYLGNRSSGRQGFAIALVAAARGADVTLIAANAALPTPPGVRIVPVGTAAELQSTTNQEARGADAVIMAAAVADFRPIAISESKIKKVPGAKPASIDLAANPDILAGLVADRGVAKEPVIVGFAAETGDADGTVSDYGRAKLRRKGCEYLVINDVSGGAVFSEPVTEATIIGAGGFEKRIARGPKAVLAAALCDVISDRLAGR